MKTLCISHKDCKDGSMAAAIVKLSIPDVHVIFKQYGESAPESVFDDTWDRIIMVDFSFPREAMLEISAKWGDRLLVLDHHKTAQEALEGIEGCFFDMGRSGCGLAWEKFFGSVPPDAVQWIEDRDLWAFNHVESKPFHAGLGLYNYDDLEFYMKLIGGTTTADSRAVTHRVLVEGEVVLRSYEREIERLLNMWKEKPYYRWFVGNEIPTINCTQKDLVSELAHRLANISGRGMAVAYSMGGQKSYFSIRSTGDIDVSAIAKELGGGGHKNAAGFTIPR